MRQLNDVDGRRTAAIATLAEVSLSVVMTRENELQPMLNVVNVRESVFQLEHMLRQ